ncbi:MAG: PIN domain-containing protein [Patescibacteria group bacterium]|nr:PIN domain-containing protein [Patescibacteria group bacterium]
MERNFREFLKNFDEQNLKLFRNSYESFNNLLTTIKKEISPEILENLHKFFINILNHIAEGFKFRLEFVIDTNIIFGEIRAILKNNPEEELKKFIVENNMPSFLQKIIDFPFLKLFAPPKIKKELFSTIDNDLPEDLDKKEAVLLANYFLEKIIILTQKNSIVWRKANNFLAKHDKDDIPFLALAIYLDAHGIITKNQHFEKQNAISVWKLGESGRMVSSVSQGAFSIYILDKSLNRILPEIVKFFILFFQSFLEFCHEIYKSVKSTYEYLVKRYSSLPKWLKVGIPIGIVAIPSLILAFSGKSRKSLKNYFINLQLNLNKDFRRLYDNIKYNIEITKEIIVKLLPFIDFSIDGLGYLFYSAYQFCQQIKLLDNKWNYI